MLLLCMTTSKKVYRGLRETSLFFCELKCVSVGLESRFYFFKGNLGLGYI